MKTSSKIIIMILIVIIFSIIGFVFTYMFLDTDNNNVDVYSSNIYDEIYNKLENSNYFNQMIEISNEQFEYDYKIDKEMIEDYIIYIPSINIKADEIAIIKLSDLKYLEDVKLKFQERSVNVSENFSTYLESENLKAKEAIIFNKDKYVFMIISEYDDEIKGIIDEYFNN